MSETKLFNAILRAITYGDLRSTIIQPDDPADWRYAAAGQTWSEAHWKPVVSVLLRHFDIREKTEPLPPALSDTAQQETGDE